MTRNKTGFFVLATALIIALSSCAGGPKPLEAPPTTVLTYAPEEAGRLLGWTERKTIRASSIKRLFSAAAPAVLSTQLKMTNLDAIGYPRWRTERRPGLQDVRPIAITFVSRRPEGGAELQSGLLALPELQAGDRRSLTWVVLMRGTEFIKDAVPSRGRGVEMSFAASLAALGYAVWTPDYAGMGDGEGAQEYCVPDSLADSGLDGLAAARSWLAGERVAGREDYGETGRLVILGYSEGGLGAMACLESLTRGRLSAPGLELSVVYPMGAPLNLQSMARKVDTEPVILDHPEYLVPIVMGWARAYPREIRMEEILAPRTIRDIVPLYSGTRSGRKIHSEMARILGKKKRDITDADLFTHEFLNGIRISPESVPYSRMQLASRLDRFTPPPGLPVILAATPTDEIVSFSNSEDEAAWAREHAPGSELSLLTLTGKDHMLGALEALLYAVVDLDKREMSF